MSPAFLPSPPTDAQRDEYLGAPARWVAPLQLLGYLLVVASIYAFVHSIAWAAFLLIPLGLSTISAILSTWTMSLRPRTTLAAHRRTVRGWRPHTYPSVDVFLPTAGEDLAVLANTYEHVARMAYRGKLVVHVLDDGDREAVELLALQYGFTYTVRPDRGRLKKAGNLNYGFAGTEGDFVLILDADFVPRTDMLAELMPYFADPSVGIVQSPQFFDVTASMNWVQRGAAATQVLFYRWVQTSRDAAKAAICVGTCALYRREALEPSGGFAAIGHSEDVYTGVDLVRHGYRVRYVPTVVSKGLCPDGFDQFLNQQYRWCQGSMSLLLDAKFHRLPMKATERACYWSGFLYYITTALDVFIAWLPPLILALFYPQLVEPQNYVFVVVALLVRQAMVPIITGGRGSFIDLARIQLTYSFAHVVSVFDAVRGRTEAWVATGAPGRGSLAVRVRAVALVQVLVVQLLLWGAVAVNASTYGLLNWSVLAAFTALHLAVAGPIALGWSGRARERTQDGPRSVPVLGIATPVPVTAGAVR